MQWYQEVDSHEPISQGDIFLNVPFFSVDVNSVDLEKIDDSTSIEIEMERINLVVLTQACDLQDGVSEVVVAEIEDIKTMEVVGSRYDFVCSVHAGRRPNYALIGKHESEDDRLNMNFQIVDFSDLHTIPFDFIRKYSEQYGRRLKLNTPHRELLSQQFGNYFSRIGLPNEDFISKTDLKEALK
ncbi:hypothetical protein V6C27_03070 [Peptococcaceae bacterium 1198_IL3148]